MVILHFCFTPNGCESTIMQGGFAGTHPERMMPATINIHTTLGARCRRDPVFAIHLGGSTTDSQFLQYIISLARGRRSRIPVLCETGRPATLTETQ